MTDPSAHVRHFLPLAISLAICWLVQKGLSVRIMADDSKSCVDYGSQSQLFRPGEYHRQMDMASVTVVSNFTNTLQLCAQSKECWDCPPMYIMDIEHGSRHNRLMVDSRFPVLLHMFNKKCNVSCSITTKLDQYSEYNWWVSQGEDQDSVMCTWVTEQSASDSNLPVYIALALLIFLQLCWSSLKYLYKKGFFRRCNLIPAAETEVLINSDLGTPSASAGNTEGLLAAVQPKPATRRERLKSLDAFRGLSLIVMVFVNYRGGWYWYFRHSAWNGLTVADLVFPWFVFIMGTSMAMSFQGLLRKQVSRRKLLLKTVKRTIILFALGLLISNNGSRGKFADPANLRIPGVLQRLALTYLAVGIMECFFARADNPYVNRKWAAFADIVPFWPEWIISLAVLALHTALTFCLPVPGCPTGYLGPGGLHEYTENSSDNHVNCTGGTAGYIDRWLFGERHIYQHPTSAVLYLTNVPFDPEGTLGTLTSIFLCFLGLQAGKVLLVHKNWKSRIARWTFWAFIMGLIAGILCDFTQNTGKIPVNKNLWSTSYILALSSMAFLLLALFYLLIDVFHIWSGAPFFYPGMNSILIYMCHEIFNGYFPVQFHVPKTHPAQLAMSLFGAILWTVVSVVLYYKKIFVSI